ncbi:magnesium/cobalt transporter CorA [archaeon]|nr:MAG: magnesium/cobalt transporter CorA [archaeon]
MRRFSIRQSKKSGLPPGTLIHVGQRHVEHPSIWVMDYAPDHLDEHTDIRIDDALAWLKSPNVTWLNVVGLDADFIGQIGNALNVHPLVLEDILNTDHRPKVEEYDDYLFIVCKAPRHDDGVAVEQLSMILFGTGVVCFHERGSDLFNALQERIRSQRGFIRSKGVDYLAYSILDTIIDSYFVTVEMINDTVDDLEETLVTEPTTDTLQALQHCKRHAIMLRKAIFPMREVAFSLEKIGAPFFGSDVRPYLRDVYDHCIQIMDTIESIKDMLSGMLDIYLSSTSNKLNEVMKVLTIISTMFIPMTFLAGVYGMNFIHMPELQWRYAYPAVLLVMASIAGVMALFFKKRGWW